MIRDFLWSSTVRRDAPLLERIEAAAAAGFKAVSVRPADFAAIGHDRARAAELRAMAEDLGVALPVMDGVNAWYPIDHTRPLRTAAIDRAESFSAAEAFGCARLCAIPAFATGVDADGLAGHFAALCDEGAERGLGVQLEFTPFPPARGLAGGWNLVRTAGRPNGALVFDTWHFFRSGPDFDLLETIPGGKITALQISDGAAGFRESLIKDTYFSRLHPGEGVFDLPRVMEVLMRIGAVNDAGPEVTSREQHALDPTEAARRSAAGLDRLARQMGMH